MPKVMIGVAVEPLHILATKQPSDPIEEEKSTDMARGIAQDLYNFITSYTQKTQNFANLGNVLVLPPNICTTWFKKFCTKHKHNPFFWMKKN
jgi:hypothetical protein